MRTFGIAAVLVSALCAGCMDKPTQQLTGTLRGIGPMQGAPPTKWVIVMGEEGSGVSMPLDVSAVQGQLNALNGKKVTITAENKLGGDTQTWVVKSIAPASPY